MFFCYDGGYYGKIISMYDFFMVFVYNLVLVKVNGVLFIFCEEDVYLNILYVKEVLDNNFEIIDFVNEKLKKY